MGVGERRFVVCLGRRRLGYASELGRALELLGAALQFDEGAVLVDRRAGPGAACVWGVCRYSWRADWWFPCGVYALRSSRPAGSQRRLF